MWHIHSKSILFFLLIIFNCYCALNQRGQHKYTDDKSFKLESSLPEKNIGLFVQDSTKPDRVFRKPIKQQELNRENNIKISEVIFNWITANWWALFSSIIIPFFFSGFREYLFRLASISKKRYLKQLRIHFKDEENFEKYPPLKLIQKPSNNDNSEYLFKDLIEDYSKIHIQGKPGSGKTSLIKKFIIEHYSSVYLFTKKRVPIYIKYNGENLFEQILNSLDVFEFYRNPTHFKEDWLKIQLKKNRFTIIIDDVHNILTNEDKREKSKIDSLLSYKKTNFVLISRDYYLGCPFNFNLFELKDLSQDIELFKKILKAHCDEKEISSLMMEFNHGYDAIRMRLYNTPQLLKLFTKVFNSTDRFEDTKTTLFTKFLEFRFKDEALKKEVVLPPLLKKRLLEFTALSFFKIETGSPYSVHYEEFRKVLKIGFDQINKEFNYGEYSLGYIENEFFQEGLLINFDGRIRFEHDQWQEYFAAKEILNRQESINDLLKRGYGNEVALFISGNFIFKEYHIKKSFWDNYWESIVYHDFFLVSECLKEEPTFFLNEVIDFFKNFQYSKTDLSNSYSALADHYNKVVKQNFPKLINEFVPKQEKNAGVIVEDNKKGIGFWYGYRPINERHPDKVVVVDQNEVLNTQQFDDMRSNISYYRNHFQAVHMKSYLGTSALHQPAIIIAYKDIENQLSELVKKGKLIEPETMKTEALFIEAVSLSKILQGNRGSLSNTSIQEVLSFNELLKGIHQLKQNRYLFSLEVPQSDYFRGLERHKVSILDFELSIKLFIDKNRPNLNEKLISPNSDLIDTIKKYRFTKDVLTENDRKFLMERSIQYYHDVYLNYKRTIEANFYNLKEVFPLYSGFPISVFLVYEKMKNPKGFGKKIVFFNTDLSDHQIDVQIINKHEESEIKKRFDGHQGYTSFWGLDSFNKTEPVRSEVYRLIRSEYEDLVRS
jgi:hypothetical protein